MSVHQQYVFLGLFVIFPFFLPNVNNELLSNDISITKNDERINFIIMLMDDMGWGDLGILGEPSKETPNLDQMAREGMLFTDFYAANPLCSPSRAAMMTGRLPVRNGFYTSNAHARNAYTDQPVVGGISQSEILLSEHLAKANYTNKIVGKWHLGYQDQYLPLNRGFHQFFGSTNCHFGPFNDQERPNIPVFKDAVLAGRYYEDFNITSNGVSNMTQLYIQEAVTFIEDQASQRKPFFLYWTPDGMHGPTFASTEYHGTSRRGRYGDSIREVDAGVGIILEKLRKLNIERQTFVFFASDNGAALVDKSGAGSNGPFLCGKQTTFEGGVRVPGIAWWPGTISENQITKQVSSVMDLFTTILDLAGISPPEGTILDGISLKDLVLSNETTDRALFHYRGNELFAVRFGDYKLHLWTWTNFLWQYEQGIDFCPGHMVEFVTTHNQTNRTVDPILFHLGRDPMERYPISSNTDEYRQVLPIFRDIISNHKINLTMADPALDWCDDAAMEWQPPGCEAIRRCLPIPPSRPYRCVWDH